MTIYQFALIVALCCLTVWGVGAYVKGVRSTRAPISYEGGVPAVIVVAVKELNDNGVFLVYTSKMLIYAVPINRLEMFKKPILGYRVTEVPRGNGEIDLFFEGQEVLVPAYVWHE